MDHKDLEPKQNIHEIGVNYVKDLLDRVGFTIHDVNKDPNHHFQLFVQISNKSMLIAIRTACYPDVGTIDEATQKELIKESEKLKAVPHFAGLSLTAMNGSDNQEGGSTEAGAYEVIFNGMTVVR
ncbi:MAG: hypothetical protein ACR2PB_11905 [Desulfocapsaceae bacterium]